MASLWVFPSSVGFVGRNKVGVLRRLTRGHKRQTSGTEGQKWYRRRASFCIQFVVVLKLNVSTVS